MQGGSAPAALRALDFLQLPMGDTADVARVGGEFTWRAPWSIVRFGRHTLARGWWVFESASDAGCIPVEVRLTSASNPLITLPGGDKARVSARVRIYLPSPETFNVAILISPWPGQGRFEQLRLRRLSTSEAVNVVWRGVIRVATEQGAAGKAMNMVRQMAGGSAVGMRANASPDDGANSNAAPRRDSRTERRLMMSRHGDVSVLLREGDRLDSRAPGIVATVFEREPQLQVICSDVLDDGVILPRPARAAVDTRWFDLMQPPVFIRSASPFASMEPQSLLAELASRLRPDQIGRVALPLVLGVEALRVPLPEAGAPSLTGVPRVSMIIPTKFRMDLLATALDGLAHRTGYPNLEIVIVDNGSTDPLLPQIVQTARQSFEVIHIRDAGDFNFSRLVNAGVKASSGEMIVLLNDDVEPRQQGWLHKVVESLLRPDVGAVGVRLLYPNGSLQHAGVMMGIGGLCGHLWKGLSVEEAACLPYVVYPGERTAVTGACLAARREVFDAVGGFDEAFPVSLNDIDFCLRVRALGKKIIYRGDAVLVHHESMSRGLDSASAGTRERAAGERQLFMTRWPDEVRQDRFGSPAFDPRVESGAAHYAALGRLRA